LEETGSGVVSRSTISGSAVELAAGAVELAAGAFELAARAFELAAGAFELAAGAVELAAGAVELAAGAVELVPVAAELDPVTGGATRVRVSSSGAGLLSASVPIAKPTARQRSMVLSAAKNAKSLVRHESWSP